MRFYVSKHPILGKFCDSEEHFKILNLKTPKKASLETRVNCSKTHTYRYFKKASKVVKKYTGRLTWEGGGKATFDFLGAWP